MKISYYSDFQATNNKARLVKFTIGILSLVMPIQIFATTCQEGEDIKWYAGNAVENLFSAPEAACKAFDTASVGRPSFYHVSTEPNPNGLNFHCFFRSDTQQSPIAAPLNLANAAIACGETTKNLGCRSSLNTKNPCNTATGNKFREETDFSSNVFRFTRFYNSAETSDIGLGSGWRSNFQKRLSIGSQAITIIRADSRGETLHKHESEWQGDPDSEFTLMETETGFIITLKQGGQEFYDSIGRIMKEVMPSGRYFEYSYSSFKTIPQKITDTYGRSLEITSDNRNKIASIQTPDNKIYQYSYGENGNLIMVTFPTPNQPNSQITKIYHYEDPAFPNHLTGITDENGDRYATFSYDQDGKATVSQLGITTHSAGQEKIKLVYH